MRFLPIYFLLLFPLYAFAYTSVIAKPADPRVLLPIVSPENSQEFFGRLDGFPHTFEFTVSVAQPFKAQVFVPDRAIQKNDISIMIVKNERRGVTEIGRTKIKEQTWESQRDLILVEKFRDGGQLEGNLEPGTYKLEVSSPNNEGKYRMVWGAKKIHRWYFSNLRTLFEVKSFLDNSKFTTILSPLVYIPLFLMLGASYFVYRRKQKAKVA